MEPEKRPEIAAKAFRHPDLDIETHHHEIGDLPPSAATRARQHLGRLNVVERTARIDRRSGRFITLLPTTPLLPGRGVGNRLAWSDLGVVAAPKSQSAIEEIALGAFRSYLDANQADLMIDPSELSNFRIASHGDGDLIQIHAQRAFEGVPVRGSFLSATIGQGNLTLMSTHRWGDRRAEAKRRELTAREAIFAAREYLAPLKVTREWGKPHRLYLPMALGKTPGGIALGRGYSYRLAWSIKFVVDGDQGAWEVLVDASSGEILANEDQNHYGEARGGVYPVSNDGLVPDGVEQAGWPMPYQEVSTPSGTETTDTGGNLPANGSLTATFFGPYVNINDNCGSASLTGIDTVDWGASGGTDCATPGFGGAGNTHASRTGFYELNKIIEMARGQLPNHPWLQSRLTSNMNINLTCNAFFSTANGSVNFYRSGGGCFNTGEIAGVFDHEWGHGMDFNDVNGGIASPSGEGIADIYTALRLNDSCIGRNFFPTVCDGFGDPCLACTGVRDIDYLKRQSGQPHDYSWSNANCGGQVHCVGSVYAEAVWSLWKRTLQAAPYSYDDPTAHEIVTRLSFLGAGATSTWFSGGPPNGGCGGSSGYMNYLAADDDNGNLNDGTPHMTAIFQAFNDQEIACNTPAVQDSGCSGTPSTAPSLTGTSGNRSASLSWNTVSGASSYEVFRTEGVFGCDFGRVKLGETTGTSWNDSGLQNGRGYSYMVISKGPSDSCFGPASSCATLTPASGPDFSVSCAPGILSIEQGQNVTSTCTVTSIAGFSGTVHLSCSGAPSGIGCAFSPTSLNPTGASSLTLSVDLAQNVGSFLFDVVGDDGSVSRTSGLSVTVTPEGQNGPQDAIFDAGLGAPRCSTVGSECDSVDLLEGRGGNGPEPNQPNTLDACADGASGTYHSDESNDRILVRTLDSFDFVEGATVEVEATVWAWTTPSSDRLDLYFAADATNPNWTLIDSITPAEAGAQTLSAQYTLPAGSLQAVRANFRYQGSQSPCSGGAYDDADDLVFAVASAGPQCSVDADCDDGLFCNGAEVCNAGSCEAGTAPSCDDGVACTVDSCDESIDSCDFNPNDSLCDNGLFCDGAETCSATLGCQAGAAPSCDDGVGCTMDACNEGAERCDNLPDHALCDNGLFCDGAETCDAVLDCQASSDPCGGLTCDEAEDTCVGDEGQMMEWGTVLVGVTPVTVSLTGTYSSPVVVTSIQYDNNTIPVVTRIDNVTGTSFDIRLQNAGAGSVAADLVSYLVVEEGVHTLGGVLIEAQTYTSTVTDENNSWVGEARTLAGSFTNPVVVGQVMSSNDADWSVFWDRGTNRTSPPSASALRTGKTVCEDTVVTRADETVGFVVIEAGHGILGGVEFEAALGADTVRGVTNAPPYTYTFSTAFASAPTVAVVSMAAVDGNNGGWAYTYGSAPMSTNGLDLAIDEDTIGDSERKHTPEQVGYIVFASPGSATP